MANIEMRFLLFRPSDELTHAADIYDSLDPISRIQSFTYCVSYVINVYWGDNKGIRN